MKKTSSSSLSLAFPILSLLLCATAGLAHAQQEQVEFARRQPVRERRIPADDISSPDTPDTSVDRGPSREITRNPFEEASRESGNIDSNGPGFYNEPGSGGAFFGSRRRDGTTRPESPRRSPRQQPQPNSGPDSHDSEIDRGPSDSPSRGFYDEPGSRGGGTGHYMDLSALRYCEYLATARNLPN